MPLRLLGTEARWRLRCFPAFFVIGVTKCGTTHLCQDIAQYVPGHVNGGLKEYHYWDQHRYPQVPKKCRKWYIGLLHFFFQNIAVPILWQKIAIFCMVVTNWS